MSVTGQASRDAVAGVHEPHEAAWRPLLLLCAGVAALLIVTSRRYGYHRDELYFLVAGRHPDWGYPDQPPLTPLLVRLMDAVAPGSLVVLRLPSALAAAAVVLLTALLARELGGGRRAQLIAAALASVAAVLLVTGHFVTTTTFDLVFSALLCWLVARVVRTGDDRLLLPAGLVLGVGLLNKTLIGVLAATLVLGALLAGPRRLLRSRWALAGGLVAVALGLPYVLWQATNGWPQGEMARVIAGEGDQGGRPGVVLFQLLLVSPVLVPVWVAGLVRLLRSPAARPFRFFAVGYLVLTALYVIVGGKSYYVAGYFPVLLASGGIACDGWLARGRSRLRAGLLASAVALSGVAAVLIGLAVLPPRDLGPVLVLNPDTGEELAWPAFTDTVAGVWRSLPEGQRADAILFTGNYGEAGALARYGPERGLPQPYSGHNAFGWWAVPPDSATTAVVVGLRQPTRFFARCDRDATIDNGLGLDTEEQGNPVWICRDPVRPWSRLWPEVRHLG